MDIPTAFCFYGWTSIKPFKQRWLNLWRKKSLIYEAFNYVCNVQTVYYWVDMSVLHNIWSHLCPSLILIHDYYPRIHMAEAMLRLRWGGYSHPSRGTPGLFVPPPSSGRGMVTSPPHITSYSTYVNTLRSVLNCISLHMLEPISGSVSYELWCIRLAQIRT